MPACETTPVIERQSHRDDVSLCGELGARCVQLGAKDRGESGRSQRPGVCQREPVPGAEVIGDGQEIVAGLLAAACDFLGWQRPVGTVGMRVQVAPPEAARSIERQVVQWTPAPRETF